MRVKMLKYLKHGIFFGLVLFPFIYFLYAQENYKLPPKVICDILDAPPLPDVILSPDRNWMLFIENESMPRISDLAQPSLGLAGIRVNTRNNSILTGSPRRKGLLLKNIISGREVRIPIPPDSNIYSPEWSPDGRYIAFLNVKTEKIELWLSDTTGKTRILLNSGVNAISRNPLEWFPNSKALLCQLIPKDRGNPPQPSFVPFGPNIQIADGKPSPVRTYQNLLKNPFDEKLFDYYFTSQLAIVDLNGNKKFIGSPSIYAEFDISPDGKYILLKKIVKPYSYLVPMENFAKKVDVWSSEGKLIRTLAELPLAENVPINGVPTGPRAHRWAGYKSLIIWAEALDGGNPKVKAEFRDRIMLLEEPFTGDAKEIFKTNYRYSTILFGEDIAILSEFDRPSRKERLWLLSLKDPYSRKLLFDINREDRYKHPGSPVMGINNMGKRILLQTRDKKFIYLSGEGASPEEDRPFLDRLELESLKKQRIFQSEKNYYEQVISLIDENAEKILTRRESKNEPPNYFLRVKGSEPVALTNFKNPAPQLSGVKKEDIFYEREDGIKLSGTLYLPPGWKGERLPLIMWVYPFEFQTADAASQVRRTENRFTFYRGASHLFLLTQGYAILDNPSLPVVGRYGNDTYVLQVVAGARAAIKKVVEMGVADPDRLGVGGHSYGAFTTANLLAHTDFFKGGVARSGAYNRTLTPFGFQNEDRTLWEAPDTYIKMSPFMYANMINEPILIIHGEADDNPGTFPIQSERLFHAIKGHGGITKFVKYPYESHGYRARETVLDCIYQMIDWFDTYVKKVKDK
ncbi:MAG: prolyl oligopeptidase family serine peptidase [Candidatus Aminicenantia bacterium]